MTNKALEAFLPPIQQWFREAYGEPTPPQAQGWPAIQRGEHTLILAPTGSGKTLAAFLWGIDHLFRELTNRERQPAKRDNPPAHDGVRLLYVSPLKALNNDIERNLRTPLEGIRAAAERMNQRLPGLRVTVRTGDTPSAARAQMVKRPPHILITTPESLYLILTSPRAREMLRTVRTVIVDEIHTLVGDKRGVHLALSLERLCHLAQGDVQRIGLSATIRPLDEVARFLGGQSPASEQEDAEQSAFAPRPVTVINAGYRKPLDLEVVTAVEDLHAMEAGTIWPYVVPRVLQDIMTHRTTLIFANNRRLAERTADRLNAQFQAVQSEDTDPLSPQVLAPGGTPREGGLWAIGAEGPFRAHHGSMSKEARRKMEEDLKAGRLPALVGTSSLELGIDIGAIDLVVQLQSPKSVAQGLQRVGRSGHLVGQTSAGRIYATFGDDLIEAAAVVRGMLDGDVEETRTPQNPLDVLAQQIVAMVAVEPWGTSVLYDVVRRAYAYREMSRATFDVVLGMLSGKYHEAAQQVSALRARISWDRVNDRLSALPGARLLAMSNAGTIGDRGAYGVYLSDGKTKLGELDEEFVYETRAGNNFLLGSQVWRVLDIQHDRVIVGDAAGAVPRMPFWRGDYPWRTYDLGVRIGKFRRELVERLKRNEDAHAWLQREYCLDDNSVNNLIAHVRGQLDAVGVIASDRSIVVESFADTLGARVMVVQTPFGGRVNGAWALALTNLFRERVGVETESQVNDDGILFRLPQTSTAVSAQDIKLSPPQARERILRELAGSSLFGAHFRMNAQRALLLPRAHGKKRTPFWLQRLKAKDLLAITSQFDDFPIMAETYRDCLSDVLDLPHLEEVLEHVQSGAIEVVAVDTHTPSPVASALLYAFQAIYQYEWDEPKAERDLRALSLRRDVLDDLLGAQGADLSGLLKPSALARVQAQAQHLEAGFRARTVEELALVLFELGDLSTEEIEARCAGDGGAWIAHLKAEGRVVEIAIPAAQGSGMRYVHIERAEEYRSAFAGGTAAASAALALLRRLFRSSGPLTRGAILARYAFDSAWLEHVLAQLVESRELARGRFTAGSSDEEFVARENLEQIHRRTLTLLRQEVKPVSLFAYADFVAGWQSAHPRMRQSGDGAVHRIMQQLSGVSLPGALWEREILPARLNEEFAGDLAELMANGELTWVGAGRDARRARVRFFGRGQGGVFLHATDDTAFDGAARAVFDFLKGEGASFAEDIVAGVGVSRSALGLALVEMALAGAVSCDSLESLRALIAFESESSPRTAISELEAELASRMNNPTRLTAVRYRAAKKRVRARIEVDVADRTVIWGGRWSLVRRLAVMGKPLSDEERAERLTRTLLMRYGVLARECLEHEDLPLEWTALYLQLQRLEMRGEVRRGYFVAGLSGAQFAAPDAVERLRACVAATDDTVIVLNATDPANMFGGEMPGAPRFARVPSTHAALWRGQPVLVAEDQGSRVTVSPDVDSSVIERALGAYLGRANAPRQITVREWNGADVLGSPGEPILRTLGFSRAPAGMERWGA